MEQGKRPDQTERATHGCLFGGIGLVLIILLGIMMFGCSGEIYHTPSVSRETCPVYHTSQTLPETLKET